jgi:nitrile hydratase
MDGVHDLGGVEGFGPVEVEQDEPAFHEDWERRAFRVSLGTAMALQPTGGAFRHSIERMDPAQYLSTSYYEHWLTGWSTLIVEAGLVSSDELDRRAGGRFPLSRPDRGTAPAVPEAARTDSRFTVGDQVRVREWHPFGHTRAPRYVQGKRGVVVRVDGPYSVPDIEAHGGGRVLDPTYSVRFTPRELWGEGGADGEEQGGQPAEDADDPVADVVQHLPDRADQRQVALRFPAPVSYRPQQLGIHSRQPCQLLGVHPIVLLYALRDQPHLPRIRHDHFVPHPRQLPAYPWRMRSHFYGDPAGRHLGE